MYQPFSSWRRVGCVVALLGASACGARSGLVDRDGPADLGRPPDGPIAVDGGSSGTCTNAADMPLLDDTGDTPTKRDIVSYKASNCIGGCLDKPDPSCTADCIKTTTGLSAGCAQCYASRFRCLVDKCFAECAANRTWPPCVNCVRVNCEPAFVACSGLPPHVS